MYVRRPVLWCLKHSLVTTEVRGVRFGSRLGTFAVCDYVTPIGRQGEENERMNEYESILLQSTEEDRTLPCVNTQQKVLPGCEQYKMTCDRVKANMTLSCSVCILPGCQREQTSMRHRRKERHPAWVLTLTGQATSSFPSISLSPTQPGSPQVESLKAIQKLYSFLSSFFSSLHISFSVVQLQLSFCRP